MALPRDIDFPYHFDATGRSAKTTEDDHIRDLIHQVLFTSPGERVNRPEFGCGLKTMLFMPNNSAVAAATQVLVKAALQKWLGDMIHVDEVEVSSRDERLQVSVAYAPLASGERRIDQFAGTV